VPPGRNDPCHCGSGKKYKKCHLDIDRDARRAIVEALPILQAKHQQAQDYDRRLREEFGVHVHFVSPVPWQGGKVWAIGSRVYPGRRATETFHDFILHVLRETLGKQWHDEQAALPADQRHFVMKCFEQLAVFQREHANPEELAQQGQASAEMNGWVQYLISLAWDITSLIHAGEPPEELFDRLRDRDAYQGARYELAIAAIFARLNCSIRWLDADPTLTKVKHVEFEATHRPSLETFAVEAKSRHRAGVINQPGVADPDDPLRADSRMVRKLFTKALAKAPTGLPYFIFIDINAPREADADWQQDIQRWMNRMPPPTPAQPEAFNATYVTNFSPHYDADSTGRGGAWLVAWPPFARNGLQHDIQPELMQALNAYGRVPAFAEDGTLLD